MPAQAWPVAALAGLASVLVAVRVVLECGSAVHAMRRVVEALRREEEAAAARGAQDAGAADLVDAIDAADARPGGGAGPEAR
jgi:Arc/MetJ family transcription regulator